jgi:hypothetical protein
MAAMAAILDFCKIKKIQNIALVGLKNHIKFHFDRSKFQKLHQFEYFTKIQDGRHGGHIGFLSNKKNVKYSHCRDENYHQVSIRSPKGFKIYIDFNILQKTKMVAMAAILDFCKKKKKKKRRT